jgi:ATP/maltotriose-dependent transcriptional regulator MalT
MFHGFEILVKAKCSFAEKRYGAVLNTLSGGQKGLGKFILGRLEMRVLEAVTFLKLGEPGKALDALADAWDMAASNSLDMPFIELGEDMYTLASAVLAGAALAGTTLAGAAGTVESPIPRSWLEGIRSKSLIYAKKLLVVVEQYRARQGSLVLSFREMEVLKGLSQGLTREEIAGDGNLSLGTVKNVITGLYAKLGAQNRADAIRIAGSAGLL